jgi:hypothetical protein
MIDNESFKLMLNVLANILNEQILVKPKLFKQMYKHKNIFRKLVDPRQSIEHKKKFIANQKGGIWPVFGAIARIVASAAPIIARVAARAAPIVAKVAPHLGKAALSIGTEAVNSAITKRINE